MKIGDLVKFDYIHREATSLNNKVGVFLGDRPINRPDGVVVNNFSVWMLHDGMEHICDRGVMKWLRKIDRES